MSFCMTSASHPGGHTPGCEVFISFRLSLVINAQFKQGYLEFLQLSVTENRPRRRKAVDTDVHFFHSSSDSVYVIESF